MRKLLPLLLALAAGCAAKPEIVVHSEPLVVAEGEERLAAETATQEDGSVLLKVYREREREVELEFWKMRGYRQLPGGGIAVASLDSESEAALLSFLAAVAAVGAAVVVGVVVGAGAGVVYVVYKAGSAVVHVFAPASEEAPPPAEEGRVTVRRTEVVRKLSPSVSLLPLNGERAVDLGIQPTDGFRLDSGLLARLGGIGARVIVQDQLLRTEVLLGTPR